VGWNVKVVLGVGWNVKVVLGVGWNVKVVLGVGWNVVPVAAQLMLRKINAGASDWEA